MAFTPYPNSNSALENPSILASNDGVNWEEPNGLTNPIAHPESGHYLSDPELVYDNRNNVLVLLRSYLHLTAKLNGIYERGNVE
jgi:hypothetical protein